MDKLQKNSSLASIIQNITLGQYEEALGDLENLILEQTDHWSAYHLSGVCCFSIAQYSQAKFFFQNALKVNPDSFLSTQALASTLIRLGQLHEGLFQYKISLTKPEEEKGVLFPEYLDFHFSLKQWKLDSGLMGAKVAWQQGRVDEALDMLEQFGQVRDPVPDELMMLIEWYIAANRYEKALETSVLLIKNFGKMPKYDFLACKILCLLGEYEAVDEILPTILSDADSRLRSGAISLIRTIPSARNPYDYAVYLNSWRKDRLVEEFTPPETQHNVLQKDNLLSVGVLFSDFHQNSSAIWFLHSLDFLYHANVHAVVYLQKSTEWTQNAFRQLGFEVIEIDNIDDTTLKTIIYRNGHQCLWDFSRFDENSMLHPFNGINIYQVGFLSGHELRKTQDIFGYDAVITSTAELANLEEGCFLFSDYYLQPELKETQQKQREDAVFIVGLALRPYHVKQVLQLLQCLLKHCPNLYLSLDQDLLSISAEETLSEAIEAYPAWRERIVLHDTLGKLDTNHVAEHLKHVDLYLSAGVPIYDFAAITHSVPSLSLLDLNLEDNGLMHCLLSSFSDGKWQQQSFDALLEKIILWHDDPSAWFDAQQEYLSNLQKLSAPGRNLDVIYRWCQTLCP